MNYIEQFLFFFFGQWIYLEPNWMWVFNMKVTMTKKCFEDAQADLLCLRDESDADKGVT
jgi:hypothetical protein